MAIQKRVATTVTQPRIEAAPIAMPTIDDTPLVPLTFLTPDIKMLISGDTGAGKTAQLGLLAEYLYVVTKGKTTVLFTMDEGGFLTLKPLIDLGVVQVVHYDGSMPPWIWIARALRGQRWTGEAWESVCDPETVALAAYEGLTAFSEFMLEDLSRHSAENPTQAVGGDSAWTFKVSHGDDVINMASNTMSHYGLVQMRIMHEIIKARPGVPSLWTSVLTRTADPLGGGILGPQTVGRAQAHTIPRLYDLSFRIDAETKGDKPSVHTLFMETHEDKASKGARVDVNPRLPLSGSSDAPVDVRISPANLVLALQQIQARHNSAVSETKARLARLMGKK